MKIYLFFCIPLLFLNKSAYAFPELVRHGYTNCIACHISPSGGGTLTSYGKNLSRELLSQQWFTSGSGSSKNLSSGPSDSSSETKNSNQEDVPERFRVGGDVRSALFHLENEFESKTRFIPMQAQAELAFNEELYAIVGRLGLTGKGSGGEGGEGGESGKGGGKGGGSSSGNDSSNGFVNVPVAYVMARFQEIWSVRAGKFLPGFGLNNSVHVLSTRGLLGFGFDDQRIGVEVSRLDEHLGLVVSSFGRRGPDLGEAAYTVQGQYSPNDSSKFALNYWKESALREIYGFWFITALKGPFYLLGDWNNQTESDYSTKGYFRYTKLGYEAFQGFHVYMMSDNSKRDLSREYTQVDRLGPGIQYFPWPHFEIDAAWLKEKNRMYSAQEGDFAYVLLHFYL